MKKPVEVSALDACCLPVAGLTALQAIRDYAGLKLDGKSGANVLITAASGGVGLYAVQVSHISTTTYVFIIYALPLHTSLYLFLQHVIQISS